MRDRESGLTLTRDRRKKLSCSGRVHPDRLPSGERQNGGQGGRSSPCRRGQGEGEAHPLQGCFAYSKTHTCKEINTGIYFAFFVAPSGVILSSKMLDSVSSILLDNRSLWGDTTTPPIEGRWSLNVDPSKPLILLGLWRRIEKGQTDCSPLDPSNYKHRGLVTTCFQVYYTFPARNIQALDADPSEGGLFLCRMLIQRKNEK